jgi:hypothetical protein
MRQYDVGNLKVHVVQRPLDAKFEIELELATRTKLSWEEVSLLRGLLSKLERDFSPLNDVDCSSPISEM